VVRVSSIAHEGGKRGSARRGEGRKGKGWFVELASHSGPAWHSRAHAWFDDYAGIGQGAPRPSWRGSAGSSMTTGTVKQPARRPAAAAGRDDWGGVPRAMERATAGSLCADRPNQNKGLSDDYRNALGSRRKAP